MNVLSQPVPFGWRAVRVKDIAEVKSGSTPLRSRHDRYYKNGSVPWVKTMDLTNGDIVSTDELVTEVALSEVSLKVFSPGTVFVAMYGGFNQIGRTGLLTFEGTCNQALSAILVNKEKITPQYLLYWLNLNVNLWRRFAASSRKDPNITKNDVLSFPVWLPPLPEQRKIAEVLSTWDEAIAKTEQLIAALERRKQGLMQRLLTGEVRFAGFDKEWKEVSLQQVLVSRNKKASQAQGFELYSLTIENGVTPKTDRYNREFLVRSDNKKYKLVYPNDIVYNPSNLRWGAIAKSNETKPVLVSPIYEVLRIKELSQYNINFIFFALSHPDQIQRFSQLGEGTLVERIAVKLDAFLASKIPIPPTVEEQIQIAKILNLCEKELSTLTKKLEFLNQQKKSLMQRLLTGQVRVKV